MNKNELALELDKILLLLQQETACSDAAELAKEMKPERDIADVRLLLKECDDAFVLTSKFGTPSFNGLNNVKNPLRRAEAGSVLNLKELLDIAGTLRAFRALKHWRRKSEGMKTTLDGRFQMIMPIQSLEEKIFTAIISEEEVADSASPMLMSIRRKIRASSAGIREKLDKLIRSQSHQKHLQDAIVTQRSGRFVVPVKSEYRTAVPGLIHDTSASGATVFIEPMSVVEANNEIRVLQSKEREEIDRILMAFSSEVGQYASEMAESYDYAVQLDLIFAKANLGYKMKGIIPKTNAEGRINLERARHPLIGKDKVVPIDIQLGNEFDSLIITGPNTGGKTVALKTLGLFTLMTMCGLMIPAGPESEVAVFHDILVDIGDEQSIEQSLSTFSAHMTNIIGILKRADKNSLVLIDELGAGTDPVEGAALATSIIEELRSKRVHMACTTHYAELKVYALRTEGVENGCCEFDVATLRPTYRLLIGIPGKSNAFAISQRLGMPRDVVERARGFVSGANSAFEDVIGRLEESRRKMENELETYREETRRAKEQAAQAERLRKQAEAGAQKEIDNARKEAEKLVVTAKARANHMLGELEDIKKQQGKAQLQEYKARMKAGLNALESMSDPVTEKKSENYVLPRKLKVGDNVLIYDIDKKATVLEEPKGDMVLLQAGILKTRMPLSNLRLITGGGGNTPKTKERQRGSVTKTNMSDTAVTEVDLRGKNVEESLMEVDSAIDHAVMRGILRLTIIHGKGTGVLRSAVQNHLRHSAAVKSFRLGAYGEGESGVTIAELKTK